MSTQVPETQETAEPEAEETSAAQQKRQQKKESRREMVERAKQELEAERDLEDEETYKLKVFRYDPEVAAKQEPRFDEFHVPFHKGMTVLDALMYARDHYDASLTFRHSCRQAVCGSDALFVNGRQRLGCQTQLADLEEPVRIEPLPHQEVVKDLVVEMEHFYDQMESVEPYFDAEETPEGEEQRQSRENHEKVKMSTRCIWCGACMSSCNIAAGDNQYLGPAAINKAYRFAMDEREGENRKEHRMEILEQEHGVWRCQTQFSCTEVCPKDIPLTEHIQELKREAVKSNLKFW
ncbi:succinate dehydrogenase / fumarate reductase iron-sulfur subunit [Halogranum gelatinilyticum]|uniref:Succinate dehydrogenase / fumarate reductase iron-sulfur subunit n=1 Tax=Halogranum gelatinilyticum TaxID=660521 RepID=A0A1G9SUP8_9EURY|nr:succinate dehydrogenase/fumarate reductase iron-sulfur subunit [Halogranum gelatinilyticum]SDM39162.1 succinate dehydrogenase / fumarate reductase iron-sulfur subunit [Halogranum gelatinilyticum]